jgi:hypothetical protein
MYKNPGNRKTWDPNAKYRWWIGTSTNHYQSYTIRMQNTKAECISDTVFFKHTYLMQPPVTKQMQL